MATARSRRSSQGGAAASIQRPSEARNSGTAGRPEGAAPDRLVLLPPHGSPCPPVLTQASSAWNPPPAPVSSPALLLPVPAIVFIAVGIYLLLLGLVLLTRRCLLAQDCCPDCSSPCRKQSASSPRDCCWTCAEACDFPLPNAAHFLDACCPQPMEAGWVPRCPRCCPLCDCACACQLPDCQSLNCLCFEIKLR